MFSSHSDPVGHLLAPDGCHGQRQDSSTHRGAPHLQLAPGACPSSRVLALWDDVLCPIVARAAGSLSSRSSLMTEGEPTPQPPRRQRVCERAVRHTHGSGPAHRHAPLQVPSQDPANPPHKSKVCKVWSTCTLSAPTPSAGGAPGALRGPHFGPWAIHEQAFSELPGSHYSH